MPDINDIKNWHIQESDDFFDEITDKEVSEIFLSIIKKSRSSLLSTDAVRILGLISMISGIEYHHDNFITHVNRINSYHAAQKELTYAKHEAVAWVNRIGQFHAFKKSTFAKQNSKMSILTPKIDSINYFRHKHTAHRSIDSPQGESPELQMAHAMSLSDVGGAIWAPRENSVNDASKAVSPGSHYLVFRINSGLGGHHSMNIEKDQSIVLGEIFEVLKNLLEDS